jgi:hypothetical protein
VEVDSARSITACRDSQPSVASSCCGLLSAQFGCTRGRGIDRRVSQLMLDEVDSLFQDLVKDGPGVVRKP